MSNHSGVPVKMHCSLSENGRCEAKNVKGFAAHIGRYHRKCKNGRLVHAKKGTQLEALARYGACLGRGRWIKGPWEKVCK